MGSLEHIDSGVIVVPKAVLPHTLLVHLLRHLISLDTGEGGKNILLLVCHSWEWERK